MDLDVPDLSANDLQQPLKIALEKIDENVKRATGWFGTVEYDTSEVNAAKTQHDFALQEQGEVAQQVAQTYAEEAQEWEQNTATHTRYHANHRGLTVAWARQAIALLETETSDSLSE